jgi:hypothetical protein
MGMGLTARITLGLVGVVLAALIPMAAAKAGLTVFWSQALGIVIGSFPIFVAFANSERRAMKAALPWAAAMATAALVALAIHRVLG